MENLPEREKTALNFCQLSASELDQILQEKDALIELKDQAIEKIQRKLTWFEEQFNLLKQKHYAKSSETQTAVQGSLFDEDEAHTQTEAVEKETITYTRPKKPSPPSPLDTRQLPRECHTIDLSEAEKQCACGSALERFGEERKEEVVFRPATLKVIEHIRFKYSCRSCETVKMPKAVELPLSKSKASASLLAEMILNKYRYHLPFYRQSQLFSHLQLPLSDSTLAHWVMSASEQLAPLGEAFWGQLAKARALQVDETPVKVLKPEKKGYMWVYHSYLAGHRFVLFDFNLSRSGSVVNERLKDYRGLLQTDGYAGYGTQRNRSEVVTVGCWDHARRKFVDVVKACGNNRTGKAGAMLERIAKLYELETGFKSLSFDERQRCRQEKSKAKLEAIKECLLKINAPPKSLLGIAVTYCKNQWNELTRYVEHGEAELSNCWVENQIRPFALGRRNWLFVGNESSASKAALLYSLIQSCALNDIDARVYLEYVLNQVHRMRRKEVDPATLLPHTIDKALLENTAFG